MNNMMIIDVVLAAEQLAELRAERAMLLEQWEAREAHLSHCPFSQLHRALRMVIADPEVTFVIMSW